MTSEVTQADMIARQLECALDIDAVFCVSCGQPDEPNLHDPNRCPGLGGKLDKLTIANAVEIFDISSEEQPDLDDTARALHCAIVATRITAQSGDCDLCQGSGVNRGDQLWPDHPPACRACNGSGTAQSGEGRSGAGEDAALEDAVANAIYANVRLEWHGHGYVSINPRSITIAARAALAALNARQSGEDKAIMRELRPSKAAMEKIERIEQANAAGLAKIWNMPFGSAAQSGEGERLRPMEEAPKDGSYILAIYKSLNGYALQLEGRVFAVRHEGKTPSDYDLGWALFPGHGGVPDKCFYGWMPIPAALRATDDAGGA